MENKVKKVVFEYKDANRVWWKISARLTDDPIDDGGDAIWDCSVCREDYTNPIWGGDIYVNENKYPSIEDIMKQFASDMAILSINIVQYVKQKL